MTSVIYIISGIALMIIGIIILLPLFRNKPASNNVLFTAIIDIFSTGKTKIEITSSSNISDAELMKIVLLYAAKIRYVQGEDNPEIVKLYESLFEEVSEPNPNSDDFVERLSSTVAMFETEDIAPVTVGKSERFIIRLIENGSDYFVQNDLPFPGLAVNVPISVFLLANAVANRISEQNISIFELAFKKLRKVMFDGNEPQLIALNMAALNAVDSAINIK